MNSISEMLQRIFCCNCYRSKSASKGKDFLQQEFSLDESSSNRNTTELTQSTEENKTIRREESSFVNESNKKPTKKIKSKIKKSKSKKKHKEIKILSSVEVNSNLNSSNSQLTAIQSKNEEKNADKKRRNRTRKQISDENLKTKNYVLKKLNITQEQLDDKKRRKKLRKFAEIDSKTKQKGSFSTICDEEICKLISDITDEPEKSKSRETNEIQSDESSSSEIKTKQTRKNRNQHKSIKKHNKTAEYSEASLLNSDETTESSDSDVTCYIKFQDYKEYSKMLAKKMESYLKKCNKKKK
ncbi:hypothetical protein NUSPORA_01670 [Nucleospora cyclopteri]